MRCRPISFVRCAGPILLGARGDGYPFAWGIDRLVLALCAVLSAVQSRTNWVLTIFLTFDLQVWLLPGMRAVYRREDTLDTQGVKYVFPAENLTF